MLEKPVVKYMQIQGDFSAYKVQGIRRLLLECVSTTVIALLTNGCKRKSHPNRLIKNILKWMDMDWEVKFLILSWLPRGK